MKPWLFDILACPIDKYFPLELYLFSFETKEGEFEDYLNLFQKRETSSIINVEDLDGELFINDDIIIEKTPVKEYINNIISSIKEFNHIHNKTSVSSSHKCFELINSNILETITEFSNNADFSDIDKILPELDFLNKIKIDIEIDSGLLYCEKCKRWFPIIDTIPQMLPDEFRNAEEEIKFLKSNKHLLGDTFLKQDLKPFNI